MKTVRLFLVLILLTVTSGTINAQRWDAATCADVCNLVEDGGYEIDAVLQHQRGYTLINNMNTNQGFASLYARNARVDINGNLLGLGKSGISSVIIAHLYGGSVEIGISFFSTANAKRFRDQAYEIGAVKAKTVGKTTYYILEDLIIEESPGRIGRFTSYDFLIKKGY